MTQTVNAPAETTRPGLAELVARIRPIAMRPIDPAEIADGVADVLAELAPTTALLTSAERAGSAATYARHNLHCEETFTVSAVIWRPGQLTEIHDHIVWCSFLIMQGAETETLYRRTAESGDDVTVVGELVRPTGSVSGVAPPDDIHRVHNTGDDTAITLHVYGADLRAGTSVRRTYPEPMNG